MSNVHVRSPRKVGKSSCRHWGDLNVAGQDIEPRLRRLCGYRHLPTLRAAIMKELKIQGEEGSEEIAA